MAATTPTRFDITQVQAEIAGPQPSTFDAHITTRGRFREELIAVTLGGLAALAVASSPWASPAACTAWRR